MSTLYIRAAVLGTALLATGCGGGGGYGGDRDSTNPPPMSSNAAPSITGLATTQTIAQDEQGDMLAFSISDAESAPADIVLTVESSSDLINPDGVWIGGNGANRMLTIEPAEGVSGSAVVTLRATDPSGASTTAAVNITVSSEQRSFTELVGTAYAKSIDDEPERVTGYSLVDDASEDSNAFDALVE